MRHLLVTNDFPPGVGGIQSYLWELWRRLPPDDVVVLTGSHHDAAEAARFDAAQPFRIERTGGRWLAPTPALRRRIDSLAGEVGAGLVLLDPAFPLGVVGPALGRPYGVVLHGAEVTIPGRSPLLRPVLARVLRGASLVVAAGGYPAHEGARAARRHLPTVLVPPGVDTDRFHPLDVDERAAARRSFGLHPTGPLVVSVSRLVPRKGMDALIRASSVLADRHPGLRVAIAGAGRDRTRLQRLADRTAAPVVLLGRVPDPDLPRLYGCADVFAMLCRNRWCNLEQEGFGIVFLEAAAAGVPQVAGASGGAHEAVVDGVTGFVVRRPSSVADAVAAIDWLLVDPERAAAMGRAGRARAATEFDDDRLAAHLAQALDAWAASHPHAVAAGT